MDKRSAGRLFMACRRFFLIFSQKDKAGVSFGILRDLGPSFSGFRQTVHLRPPKHAEAFGMTV